MCAPTNKREWKQAKERERSLKKGSPRWHCASEINYLRLFIWWDRPNRELPVKSLNKYWNRCFQQARWDVSLRRELWCLSGAPSNRSGEGVLSASPLAARAVFRWTRSRTVRYGLYRRSPDAAASRRLLQLDGIRKGSRVGGHHVRWYLSSWFQSLVSHLILADISSVLIDRLRHSSRCKTPV